MKKKNTQKYAHKALTLDWIPCSIQYNKKKPLKNYVILHERNFKSANDKNEIEWQTRCHHFIKSNMFTYECIRKKRAMK